METLTTGCELLSDFVYSFFEHNSRVSFFRHRTVVNCFQILYIRSLNTIKRQEYEEYDELWIAFRFCIFVLWTQCQIGTHYPLYRCELLSDFVYSFFEHNKKVIHNTKHRVVNCFQILYIRSLNTIWTSFDRWMKALWIAFRFCIFVLWTQCRGIISLIVGSCELLSDFVYSFFEHNLFTNLGYISLLWIAFRFCIFVLWTQCWNGRRVTRFCCELLSDFVYSFFEHNKQS